MNDMLFRAVKPEKKKKRNSLVLTDKNTTFEMLHIDEWDTASAILIHPHV